MNHTILRIVFGAVFVAMLTLCGWALSEINTIESTIPATYATKVEIDCIKKDIKDQIADLKIDINKRQDRMDRKLDILIGRPAYKR
jgi:hypothetical protein